jgi:hypothetical protein
MRLGIQLLCLLLAFGLALKVFAGAWPETESATFTLDTSIPRVDTDGDGMVDSWEDDRGTDPLVWDATANPDGDSLTNIEEYNAGSYPLIYEPDTLVFGLSALFTLQGIDPLVDTDSDGMPDVWESANLLDPDVNDSSLDPDNDGKNNLVEYNGGWNPQVAEIASTQLAASSIFLADLGATPYGESTDTDEDLMPDWWEEKYGLNRLVADATANPDGDNRDNLSEYLDGYIPTLNDLWGEVWLPSSLFALNTGGFYDDTDGDGIQDAWEEFYGFNPLVADSHLNPDEDGLTNLEEYNGGWDPLVNEWAEPSRLESLVFLTDTGGYNGGYSLDSDNDGMPDWWEDRYGLAVSTPDANGNPDGDAQGNLAEYNAGTEPTVFDYLYLVDTQGNVFLLDTGGKFSDLDNDGIPNWWERRFSDDNVAMNITLDPDKDGQNNLQEFEAGMDPNDGDSFFEIQNHQTRITEDGTELVITFDTQVDRIYKVFASDKIGQWPTTPGLQVSGDGNPTEVTVPLNGLAVYFIRVQVEFVRP